jgi:hypothetical protein
MLWGTGLVDGSNNIRIEEPMSRGYRITSRDVVSESFDGDIVVVDLATGRYFSLSRSAGVLWELFGAGVSPASIGAAAGSDPAPIATFAETLCSQGLLVRQSQDCDATPDLSAIARFVAAGDAPEVAVFDDLAELFTADPIHDVEEPAGWPVVKQV